MNVLRRPMARLASRMSLPPRHHFAAAAAAVRSVTTGARALTPETRAEIEQVLAAEDAATAASNDNNNNHYLLEYGGLVNHDIFWGDMDTFGHVNNVMYLKWFETDTISVVHKLEPLTDPDRFRLSGVVVSHRARKVAARIKEVIVTVDYSRGGVKAPIPEEARAAFEKQLERQKKEIK